MQAQLLLCALAWLCTCQRAAGLAPNATEPAGNVSVAWDHSEEGHVLASEGDYEEDEDEEQDPTAPMYIVDESIRVEPVIKPKQTKAEKNPDKPKRKRLKGKKNKKKKGTPCETEYKNFCIHGECNYLEELKQVTCRCHEDYFGERCGEQFMKTQRRNDISNYSTILVVVAVLLSSISFIAIVIIVTLQVRKTCPQYEEKEERKKLRQETGNGHIGV